jgi:hypothetical protein
MTFENIKQGDPFKRFEKKCLKSDLLSWTKPFDELVFNDIIERVRPNNIIELGSFLGYSTIKMLDKCKTLNISTNCVCVDTWLGGSDHLINNKRGTDKLFYKYFDIENGISGVFDQFCINILNKNYQNNVFPIVNTTDNAFIYLKEFNIKVDLIYIDASHTEDQTYKDIKNYYCFLNDNGVIFGHDINWISVQSALNRFCEEYNVSYKTHYGKYWELIR